jgi:hypothetical protein
MTLKIEVASSSDPNTVYAVYGRLFDDESQWWCECIGFAYRNGCRHMALAQEAIRGGIRKIEVFDA